MTEINENTVAEFRNTWNAERWLAEAQTAGGGTLIPLPVGLGKSFLADAIIQHAIEHDCFDLVVYLAPLTAILKERAWLLDPPHGVNVIELKPRPARLCGPTHNTAWAKYEAMGCATLAKQRVCTVCAAKPSCPWLRQYGDNLSGVRVVYATQAHLKRAPNFLWSLKQWAGAQRMLVLLDETDFAFAPLRVQVSHVQLDNFLATVQKPTLRKLAGNQAWIDFTAQLLEASTDQLRNGDWSPPRSSPEWRLAVQEEGEVHFGEHFRFVLPEIEQLCGSAAKSRYRQADRTLCFASRPYLGDKYFVLTGTSSLTVLSYRIKEPLHNPLENYRFTHGGSCWYVLNTKLSSRRTFRRNSPQILDFFAQLIAKRWMEGKRPIAVSCKIFLEECADGLARRLRAVGFSDARVVWKDYDTTALDGPHVLPLIHYGLSGVNTFAGFDAAYCLNSYFVPPSVIYSQLQEHLADDLQIDLQLRWTQDGERILSAAKPADRVYDVHKVATAVLQDREMGTVIQAIGRVRPFTTPCEIIMMQPVQHISIAINCEFGNLQGARDFFDVKTRRVEAKAAQRNAILDLKAGGLSQKAIAEQLSLSTRTVRRYCSAPGQSSEGDVCRSATHDPEHSADL